MTLWQGPDAPKRAISLGPIDEPSDELVAIYERVEKGLVWLCEHDPDGSFHLWYESRIPTYAQTAAEKADPDRMARRHAYAEYHGGRDTFERLWAKMVALEKKEMRNAQG